MAAALAAFGSAGTYDLVHTMLAKTDSGCANHSVRSKHRFLACCLHTPISDAPRSTS